MEPITTAMIARNRLTRVKAKEKVMAKVARIPRGKVKAKVEKMAKRAKRVKAKTLRRKRRIETAAGPFLMIRIAG